MKVKDNTTRRRLPLLPLAAIRLATENLQSLVYGAALRRRDGDDGRVGPADSLVPVAPSARPHTGSEQLYIQIVDGQQHLLQLGEDVSLDRRERTAAGPSALV
jgi:hypothetical protein